MMINDHHSEHRGLKLAIFPLLSRIGPRAMPLLAFFNWWIRQISELIPTRFHELLGMGSDAVILDIDGSSVSIVRRHSGGELEIHAPVKADPVGYQTIAQHLDTLERVPRRLLLRVPADHLLTKRVSFPAAARAELASLIGFELDRETPFSRAEIYWDYTIRRQSEVAGRVDVDLQIVPRLFVDEPLQALQSAGLDISGLELGQSAQPGQIIKLRESRQWERFFKDRKALKLTSIVTASVAAIVVLPLIYLQVAIAILDSRIAALTEEAREASGLRQQIDQANGATALVRREREESGSLLEILSSVTRLLPDDSHLTLLSVRSGRVTMTGLSPAAAHIVDLLAQSNAFHEPSFDAPVVQNAETGQEMFTISASVSPEGLRNEAIQISAAAAKATQVRPDVPETSGSDAEQEATPSRSKNAGQGNKGDVDQ